MQKRYLVVGERVAATPSDARRPVSDKHLKTALLLAECSRRYGDHRGAVQICACAITLTSTGNNLDASAKEDLAEVSRNAARHEADPERAAADLVQAITARAGAPLPADPPAELRAFISFYTTAAISLGAPAYNQRDHAGCYEVYAATARMLVASEKLPPELVQRLQRGLAEASAAGNADRAAWAMRHALDDLRAARTGAVANVTSNGTTGAEPVPPPSTIRGPSQSSTKELVRAAISIGAPVFDAGDPRGCFEIYATVARFLLRVSSPAPSAAREQLKQALLDAALMSNTSDQAWALRHALDRVLLERELVMLPHPARAMLRTRSLVARVAGRAHSKARPKLARKQRQRR